jgi:hypothetical protein
MVVPVSESIAFSVGITMAVVYTVGRFQPPTIGHKKLIEGVVAAAAKEGGKAYVFVSSLEDADTNPLPSALKIPILKHMFPDGVEFVDTKTCKEACGGPRNAFAWLKGQKPPPEQIQLAVGQDRVAEFNKDAIWGEERPTVIGVGQVRDPGKVDAANMSGTTARRLAGEDNKKEFYAALGYDYDDGEVGEVEAVYTKINGAWWDRSQKRKTMTPGEKNVESREHNKAERARTAAEAGLPAEAAPPAEAPSKKRRKRGGDPQSPELSGFDADAEDEPEQPKGGRRRTYRRCRKCGLPKKPETQ